MRFVWESSIDNIKRSCDGNVEYMSFLPDIIFEVALSNAINK